MKRLLLAVPLAWVAAAHLGPLLLMVRMSLLDRFPGPPGFTPAWSGAGYAAFLGGPGFPASLERSLVVAAAAAAASLLLAFPLAFHVALRVPPARRGGRLLLLAAPFWAGEVVRTVALVLLLARNGPANAVLRAAGLNTVPLLYGPGSVLLGTVYAVLLSALLPAYAALDRLPRDVLDAAADLGAGPVRRVWQVVLPLAAPGLAAGGALCFLSSLGLLAAPMLLGGPGEPLFAPAVAALFAGASGRWPQGAAFGTILLAAGLAGAAPLAWLGRRRAG